MGGEKPGRVPPLLPSVAVERLYNSHGNVLAHKRQARPCSGTYTTVTAITHVRQSRLCSGLGSKGRSLRCSLLQGQVLKVFPHSAGLKERAAEIQEEFQRVAVDGATNLDAVSYSLCLSLFPFPSLSLSLPLSPSLSPSSNLDEVRFRAKREQLKRYILTTFASTLNPKP